MRNLSGFIALHRMYGVGWHTIDKLLSVGWEPDQDVHPFLERLQEFRISSSLIKNIRDRWNPDWIKQVTNELIQKQITTVTIYDSNYPELLREIPQPPWVLYCRGDVSLLQETCFGIVGTRKPTFYGRKMTRQLGEQFARVGLTVVSGMATGIDGEAHQSVLQAGGKTIAVLGTGIDIVYPKNHDRLYRQMVEHGLVISEMPPGIGAKPGLFPQRNRIISGLSLGTIVVEAAERSGSLITADYSMEQGRDVFAVPGPVTSQQSLGTIGLIKQGAKCICHVGDVLEEYAHLAVAVTKEVKATNEPSSSGMNLSEHERLVYIQIGEEPITLPELIIKLGNGLSVAQIHPALLLLEMKQLIEQLPGGRYIRK